MATSPPRARSMGGGDGGGSTPSDGGVVGRMAALQQVLARRGSPLAVPTYQPTHGCWTWKDARRGGGEGGRPEFRHPSSGREPPRRWRLRVARQGRRARALGLEVGLSGVARIARPSLWDPTERHGFRLDFEAGQLRHRAEDSRGGRAREAVHARVSAAITASERTAARAGRGGFAWGRCRARAGRAARLQVVHGRSSRLPQPRGTRATTTPMLSAS